MNEHRAEETAWPLVDENDDGIRPAGKSDVCFYCNQKVGEPHGRDCVVVTKTVKLRYSFKIEVDVPHFWEKSDIEFHRNEGTWCADNALSDISDFAKKHGCLCDVFEAKFLEIVDGTPKRAFRESDALNPSTRSEELHSEVKS